MQLHHNIHKTACPVSKERHCDHWRKLVQKYWVYTRSGQSAITDDIIDVSLHINL